jgi:hypothetical protein
VQKHAYIIIANSNFKVLEYGFKMIDDERNDIYLLLDKKSTVTDEWMQHLTSCLKYSKLTVCSQIVNWASYTQVSATLKLMRLAVESGEDYAYIHLFQGADLPIRSQDEIHAFFKENNGKEFVEIDRSRDAMACGKAWYRHYFCHNRFFRKKRVVKILNFGLVEIQKILSIRKNTDIALYHGSALYSITGECARYVLSREKEIYRRFRWTLAGDEVFMQTILMSSRFKDRIYGIDSPKSENARLIDRTRPDGKNSPHIWRIGELSVFRDKPANKMFARKFDQNRDVEIVKALYEEFRQKG